MSEKNNKDLSKSKKTIQDLQSNNQSDNKKLAKLAEALKKNLLRRKIKK